MEQKQQIPKRIQIVCLCCFYHAETQSTGRCPFCRIENKKFRRDITNGFTLLSAKLFVSSNRPSSRTASSASRWFSEYLCALCWCFRTKSFPLSFPLSFPFSHNPSIGWNSTGWQNMRAGAIQITAKRLHYHPLNRGFANSSPVPRTTEKALKFQ